MLKQMNISKLRAGKSGRPTKEEQPLVDEKNNLKRENRQINEEINKLRIELKEYEDAKGLCLRYDKIIKLNNQVKIDAHDL